MYDCGYAYPACAAAEQSSLRSDCLSVLNSTAAPAARHSPVVSVHESRTKVAPCRWRWLSSQPPTCPHRSNSASVTPWSCWFIKVCMRSHFPELVSYTPPTPPSTLHSSLPPSILPSLSISHSCSPNIYRCQAENKSHWQQPRPRVEPSVLPTTLWLWQW